MITVYRIHCRRVSCTPTAQGLAHLAGQLALGILVSITPTWHLHGQEGSERQASGLPLLKFLLACKLNQCQPFLDPPCQTDTSSLKTKVKGIPIFPPDSPQSHQVSHCKGNRPREGKELAWNHTVWLCRDPRHPKSQRNTQHVPLRLRLLLRSQSSGLTHAAVPPLPSV